MKENPTEATQLKSVNVASDIVSGKQLKDERHNAISGITTPAKCVTRCGRARYGSAVSREGFPEMSEWEFISMFAKTMKCQFDDYVTVIRFKYIPGGRYSKE